jgi:serine/threonine-protein kinase
MRVSSSSGDEDGVDVLLHECLTGARPYPGDSAEQQVTAHLTGSPPRPTDRNPAVPASFDEVIACGMQKQPTDCFASAGDLARAASAAAEFSQARTVLAPSPRRRIGTRQFSARWANPDGTGDTPYADHLHAPPPPERKFGHGRLVLVAGAVIAFVAAAHHPISHCGL